MDDRQILETLAEQFGVAAAEGAMIYLPAARRMGLAKYVAFLGAISPGDPDAATRMLQAEMTKAELAAEKTALAGLAVMMADDNLEKSRRAVAFGMAILKAVAGALS